MAKPILVGRCRHHPGIEVKLRRGHARLLARAGRARSEDDFTLDGADAALLAEDVPAALLELGLEQRDRLQPRVGCQVLLSMSSLHL